MLLLCQLHYLYRTNYDEPETKTPDLHWCGVWAALPSHWADAYYHPPRREVERHSFGREMGGQVIRFWVVQDGTLEFVKGL